MATLASKAAQQKSDLIERVEALAKARLGEARAAPRRNSRPVLYANVPPDDLRRGAGQAVRRRALALELRRDSAPPARRKVRVFNPRHDEHGWHRSHTIVEIVNDDMPFLVEFGDRRAQPARPAPCHLVIHPILRVDARRRPAIAGLAARATRRAESFMQIRIDELPRREQLAEISTGSRRVLADVRAAVADWRRCAPKPSEIRRRARTRRRRPAGRRGRGGRAPSSLARRRPFHLPRLSRIRLRRRAATTPRSRSAGRPASACCATTQYSRVRRPAQPRASCRPTCASSCASRGCCSITKANRRSTVHRPVHMDAIGVKTFDAHGNGRRRAAVRRPVHLGRLQPEPARDPAAPPQGRRRAWRAPASRRPATTARRSRTSSRPSRATSCSRSPRTSSSTSRSASCTCRSASASRCSCAAIRSSASSPASSTCRATATTPSSALRIQEILARAYQRHGRRPIYTQLTDARAGAPALHHRDHARRHSRGRYSRSSRRQLVEAGAHLGRPAAGRAGRGQGRGAGPGPAAPLRRRLPGRLPRALHRPAAVADIDAGRGGAGQATAVAHQPLSADRGGAATSCGCKLYSAGDAAARSPTCCRCSRIWASR